MKAVSIALAAVLAVGSASAASAEEELKVTERVSGTGVAFDVGGEYTGMKLTVTGPDDYWVEATSEKEAPKVDLREGGTLSDGVYTYQLSGTTTELKKIVREYLDNGRDRGATPTLPAATRGSFIVQKGSIVKFDPTETEGR